MSGMTAIGCWGLAIGALVIAITTCSWRERTGRPGPVRALGGEQPHPTDTQSRTGAYRTDYTELVDDFEYVRGMLNQAELCEVALRLSAVAIARVELLERERVSVLRTNGPPPPRAARARRPGTVVPIRGFGGETA